MIDKTRFIQDCEALRAQSPLVHNITNYVAMNIAANVLLAAGASPLMSFCPEEMDEIVKISSALVINIGCLDMQEIAGMRLAAAAALKYGKPWVLDPVGAGASTLRTETALELVREYHPTIIRGNASEIMCLAGLAIKSRGVDSSASTSDAVEAAKALAKETGAVVSVSGAVDYVTDGERLESVANGSPLMGRVTAMGCSASALTGAFAAVDSDAFSAALNTMVMMGVAGDIAAEGTAGTGTFQLRFLDALTTFDAAAASERIRQA
ncbi:MAG: hydroxyethylthiazole kinase [Bacteroidales bacterium]|nr:hydroxyethylthiazole kinase [Bacteroidales bacterium]